MNPNPTISTTEIIHRLVVPIQTRGNIGKSTETIARCEWMNQRNVPWKGFDLDSFNRTLSTTYPSVITAVPFSDEPEGELIRILRRMTETAVTVIDPSAHMNQTILKALKMVRFHEIAAAAKARITVIVYPMDEVSDMDDIAETVGSLTDTVDWLVVRNRAKIAATRFFDGSRLESQLINYNAAFLEMPKLLGDTRNHLRAHEARLGRGISPAEALRDSSLHIDLTHRIILEDWHSHMFRNYDEVASHLVPSDFAAAITPGQKPSAESSRKHGAAINLENIL